MLIFSSTEVFIQVIIRTNISKRHNVLKMAHFLTVQFTSCCINTAWQTTPKVSALKQLVLTVHESVGHLGSYDDLTQAQLISAYHGWGLVCTYRQRAEKELTGLGWPPHEWLGPAHVLLFSRRLAWTCSSGRNKRDWAEVRVPMWGLTLKLAPCHFITLDLLKQVMRPALSRCWKIVSFSRSNFKVMLQILQIWGEKELEPFYN